jgi:hypothetical protein
MGRIEVSFTRLLSAFISQSSSKTIAFDQWRLDEMIALFARCNRCALLDTVVAFERPLQALCQPWKTHFIHLGIMACFFSLYNPVSVITQLLMLFIAISQCQSIIQQTAFPSP